MNFQKAGEAVACRLRSLMFRTYLKQVNSHRLLSLVPHVCSRGSPCHWSVTGHMVGLPIPLLHQYLGIPTTWTLETHSSHTPPSPTTWTNSDMLTWEPLLFFTSIGKRTVGLQLKSFLVHVKISVTIQDLCISSLSGIESTANQVQMRLLTVRVSGNAQISLVMLLRFA